MKVSGENLSPAMNFNITWGRLLFSQPQHLMKCGDNSTGLQIKTIVRTNGRNTKVLFQPTIKMKEEEKSIQYVKFIEIHNLVTTHVPTTNPNVV